MLYCSRKARRRTLTINIVFTVYRSANIFKLWARNKVNFGKAMKIFVSTIFQVVALNNLKPSSYLRLVSVCSVLKWFTNLKLPYKVGIFITKRKQIEIYDKKELLKWKINFTKELERKFNFHNVSARTFNDFSRAFKVTNMGKRNEYLVIFFDPLSGWKFTIN